MKIFQVINVRWFNATSWYALTLSRLLADAGHEVTVLTQGNTDTERKAKELGLPTVAVDLNTSNPVRLASATRHIIQLLKKHRPEIVNCHRGEGFFLWALLKHFGYPYKLVRTRGDQRPPRGDGINRWLHAHVADAVVVTNRRMSDYFLNTMKTPSKQLWLIHGGVDTKRFAFNEKERARIRDEFQYADDEIVLGLLGRFDRVKGHRETIEAAALLRKKGLNIKLMLIGFESATKQKEIQNLIETNGVEDITSITGKRDDVEACISAIDIGVLSSLWSEAIARSALEIMAADRPLVSTTVGVMPDLVPESMQVPPGDFHALANTIANVIEDEKLRENVLAAQKVTMSQLTFEEFFKRSLSLYKSLVDGD
ncbi:Glycosyl transferase group 1 [Pseudodesulfovibrio profundus]|uniref:Glycosyl transferase group 1 n=1 Tax=Pseudodesulfovibrio profundus TaxID=57320 RepID=A0A2C8F335_9BACT|nr:glycosyltransferase family 4 protein [Pseudodesulfovibrio profundus]SOB57013.1 Glycosyl transferase group 1 [Pseudodesulfovibrio profundus]